MKKKKQMSYKKKWWNSLSKEKKARVSAGKRSYEQNMREKVRFMSDEEYTHYLKTTTRPIIEKKSKKKSKRVKSLYARPKRQRCLYVLRCEHGKYYVGITANLNTRIKQHTSGEGGALWTKRHKPLKIISVEELGNISVSDAAKLENKKTIELIALYGLENVRGGGMCQVSYRDAEHAYNNHYKRYI